MRSTTLRSLLDASLRAPLRPVMSLSARRFAFPITLDVSGRRCVVLGGGFEATDKARKLQKAGALVQVVAAEIESALMEMASAGEIAWAARDFELADLSGAFLVMVTPEERDRVEEVERLSQQQGFLLCALDAPGHGVFANPAYFTVRALIVALASGGRLPAVLKRLREDLQEALDTDELRAFLDAMAALRERTAPGERSERLREAVRGFGLDIRVTFPAWFVAGKKGPRETSDT